jgi:hypothetical protein
MQLERHLYENNFSANYGYPLLRNQLLFYWTAKRRSTSQKTLWNIGKWNTSISGIMQFSTTYMMERLKSTTFPQIINQPTYSLRRSDPQNITSSVSWSVYVIATNFVIGGFLMSMLHYRESHITRNMVSIKDFSYLNISLFFSKPREYWTE